MRHLLISAAVLASDRQRRFAPSRTMSMATAMAQAGGAPAAARGPGAAGPTRRAMRAQPRRRDRRRGTAGRRSFTNQIQGHPPGQEPRPSGSSAASARRSWPPQQPCAGIAAHAAASMAMGRRGQVRPPASTSRSRPEQQSRIGNSRPGQPTTALGGQRRDYSGFRDFHRDFRAPRRFRVSSYRRPAGWYAHRWTFGEFLPRPYWARDYWLMDYRRSMTCRRRLTARSGCGSAAMRC